ncbi:hypothetical protein [Singulisphaera sp. PoT]|uniref:hypothetical protein n=1 Tax=Singulisphaera sp. PoT TaxID=3411797 RepID=UPI003BF46EC3
MIEDELFAAIDPIMKDCGAIPEEGEEYQAPPLDVLRYYRRPVRLHWIPWLGRALSVVAVVRQPVDVGFAADGAAYHRFLTRLAMAVNGRFPPWKGDRGLVIGLTTLVLTPEPIGPDEDKALALSMKPLGRTRVVPLGLLRVNLGQEALSFALASDPDKLFPEPELLTDALTPKFRRYVSLYTE